MCFIQTFSLSHCKSKDYEIYKYKTPFQSNAEVLEKIQLGYRMPRPADCPEVSDFCFLALDGFIRVISCRFPSKTIVDIDKWIFASWSTNFFFWTKIQKNPKILLLEYVAHGGDRDNILEAKISEFFEFWSLKNRRSKCKNAFVDIYYGYRRKTTWNPPV